MEDEAEAQEPRRGSAGDIAGIVGGAIDVVDVAGGAVEAVGGGCLEGCGGCAVAGFLVAILGTLAGCAVAAAIGGR